MLEADSWQLNLLHAPGGIEIKKLKPRTKTMTRPTKHLQTGSENNKKNLINIPWRVGVTYL